MSFHVHYDEQRQDICPGMPSRSQMGCNVVITGQAPVQEVLLHFALPQIRLPNERAASEILAGFKDSGYEAGPCRPVTNHGIRVALPKNECAALDAIDAASREAAITTLAGICLRRLAAIPSWN